MLTTYNIFWLASSLFSSDWFHGPIQDYSESFFLCSKVDRIWWFQIERRSRFSQDFLFKLKLDRDSKDESIEQWHSKWKLVMSRYVLLCPEGAWWPPLYTPGPLRYIWIWLMMSRRRRRGPAWGHQGVTKNFRWHLWKRIIREIIMQCVQHACS